MGSLNLHLIILSIGLCVGYPTLVCEERVWVLSFSRSSSEVNVHATSSLFRDILDLGIILVFIGIFSKKKCRFQPFLLICEIYSA